MKNNLIVRTGGGLAFLTIIIGSLLLGSLSFILLFLLISVGIQLEFYSLIKKTGIKPHIYTGILFTILMFSSMTLHAMSIIPGSFLAILIPFYFLFYIYEMFQQNKHSFYHIGFSLLGILYVALPFALMNYLVFSGWNLGIDKTVNYANELQNYLSETIFSKSNHPIYNPTLLFIIFGLIWTYDTFAYLFGITVGKHLLAPHLSPKKTWEGFWGGALMTFLSAYIISHFIHVGLNLNDLLVLAFIVVFFGTMGDLTESMFKRSLHIKDSGDIIPGHGGLLDRFDSFLFVAPVSFFYLVFIG